MSGLGEMQGPLPSLCSSLTLYRCDFLIMERGCLYVCVCVITFRLAQRTRIGRPHIDSWGIG